MMITIKDFSLRLSQLRLQKQVSAREMSLDLGKNSGYIQNIESGKAFPSMEMFLELCDYLKITPSDFFQTEMRNPSKLQSVIDDLKALNIDQLEAIHYVIKSYPKN